MKLCNYKLLTTPIFHLSAPWVWREAHLHSLFGNPTERIPEDGEFCIWGRFAMIFAFLECGFILYGVFCSQFLKKLAKVFPLQEFFNNFADKSNLSNLQYDE